MAGLEDNHHHAVIVVGSLGSPWQDIGGYSLMDFQDRRAIGLDVMRKAVTLSKVTSGATSKQSYSIDMSWF